MHTLLIPQLPAALSPPALIAAAGGLAYAAAWVLYQTAALTIPLALWLSFAAGSSLSLSPAAVAAVTRLSPSAGATAQRLAARSAPLPEPLAGHQLAALAVLPALLLALRMAERAVLARRQERWERRHARVTAADVQAAYQRWALPGSPAGASPAAASAAAAAEAALLQRQQLQQLRAEVGQLWAAVYGGESLPPEQLGGLQGERWLPPAAGLGAPGVCGALQACGWAAACPVLTFACLFPTIPLPLQRWLLPWAACAGTLVWSCPPQPPMAAPTAMLACC